MERSGAKWSKVERSGVERSGVEWNGVDWTRGKQCGGGTKRGE